MWSGRRSLRPEVSISGISCRGAPAKRLGAIDRLSGTQVGQYRQNPAIVVFRRLEAEPEEDRRRVFGHGALGDHELLADGGVRPALRHEAEHLAFALTERADGVIVGVSSE